MSHKRVNSNLMHPFFFDLQRSEKEYHISHSLIKYIIILISIKTMKISTIDVQDGNSRIKSNNN